MEIRQVKGRDELAGDCYGERRKAGDVKLFYDRMVARASERLRPAPDPEASKNRYRPFARHVLDVFQADLHLARDKRGQMMLDRLSYWIQRRADKRANDSFSVGFEIWAC